MAHDLICHHRVFGPTMAMFVDFMTCCDAPTVDVSKDDFGKLLEVVPADFGLFLRPDYNAADPDFLGTGRAMRSPSTGSSRARPPRCAAVGAAHRRPRRGARLGPRRRRRRSPSPGSAGRGPRPTSRGPRRAPRRPWPQKRSGVDGCPRTDRVTLSSTLTKFNGHG